MVAGGERERLLNGIVLISLSRNPFTDLRNTSVDKPKPRFARSISLSANRFFCISLILLLHIKLNLKFYLYQTINHMTCTSCPSQLLKHPCDIISPILANILNTSVSLGDYPSKLKMS